MVKPEWGKKRICSSCNTKYYDFKKSPIICPSCGIEFDADLLLKTRKGKSLSSKVTTGNDNNIAEDISNIDDIEVDTNDTEVVSDDDPLLEINKEDPNDISENEIVIDDDISFIDEEEITEDDDISDENSIDVEITEEDKN